MSIGYRNAKRTQPAIWFLVVALLLATGAEVALSSTNMMIEARTVMPEILVTPMRTEREQTEIPYVSYARGAEYIQMEQMYRTTPEALEEIPSVMVQKTSYGQGSPFLRGFTGYRTLMLTDGIRLNNAVFRDGPNQYWNTVDSLSLRAIELFLGPGSVLYGSDAIGGTLNALSIVPPIYDGKINTEGRVYYRLSSAEQSNIGRIQAGAALCENFSFIGGISLKDFGDLEGGRDVGEQPHTGYSEKDYDAKGVITISEFSTVTIAHQTVNIDNAWRTHKTIYGIDWEGLQHGSDLERSYDQHRHLTYASLKSTPLSPWLDIFELTASYQVQSEDEFRIKKDDSQSKQGFNCATPGISLTMVSPSRIGELVYGAEYYHDNVDSYKDSFSADGAFIKSYIQGPVADDATYDTAAAYLEDTIACFENNVDLVIGARGTHAAADADSVRNPETGQSMSIDDSWNNLSGSGRLLYYLDQEHECSLFTGISQGFRAPNLSDLTRYDSARSDEIETPVSNLDAEKYINYELGCKVGTETLNAEVCTYYTSIRDMIVRTPTGKMIDDEYEVTKKNAGDGYIYGIELATQVRISEHWSGRVFGSWMEGKVDTYPTSSEEEEREYISRLMPPTAGAALRWSSSNDILWFEAGCDMAAKADKLSSRDQSDTQRIPPGGTPGYVVFDLRCGYTINQYLSLSAACENIADEDYRIHGSGVNEAGRNFIVAAQASF